MSRWELLDPTSDDPLNRLWPLPEAVLPCTADNIRVEPFGSGGELALDIDTGGGCGFATLVQPLRGPVVPNSRSEAHFYFFSQNTFPSDRAMLALGVDDDEVWRTNVDIPTNADAREASMSHEADVPARRLSVHIGNHGSNVWSLLDWQVFQPGTCE